MSINHILIRNGAYIETGGTKLAVQVAGGFHINGNDVVRKGSGSSFTSSIFDTVNEVLSRDGFQVLNGEMPNPTRRFHLPFRIVGRFHNEIVFLWFCRMTKTCIWAMPLAEVPQGVLFDFEKKHLPK
jgi:hypothetical protein